MAFTVEHQVRGLDVPMDDAFAMRRVESSSRFLEPREDAFGGRSSAASEHIVEGPATEVLHHDVRAVVVLADVVDRNGVGLSRKTGCGERLACEALADGLVASVAIGQDLDRHDTAQHRIGGAVDVAHAAAPDLFRVAVARRENGDLHNHKKETVFPGSWSRKRSR